MPNKVVAVVPVYNEEASLERVLQEWLPVFRAIPDAEVRVLAVDDGSTDGSPALLDRLAADHPDVEVLHKPNSGHGPTCIIGYREALKREADWVFQFDSDGQCDPLHFQEFWRSRHDSPFLLGIRTRRSDGRSRALVSRCLQLAVYLGAGVNIPDSNVPYRLMRSDVLQKLLDAVSPEFNLVNVLLAVLAYRFLGDRMRWLPIHFRARFGGESSVRWHGFLTLGFDVTLALARLRLHGKLDL